MEVPMNVRPALQREDADVTLPLPKGRWLSFLRRVDGASGGAAGWTGDLGLAALLTAITTVVRLLVDMAVPGVAPFIFIFPIVALAVLISGPRAGLITLVAAQLLAWYAIVPVQRSFQIASKADGLGLLLSTLAEFMMLGALTAYRSAMKASAETAAGRYEDARLALRELDHRTKNNLQLMQSILYLKAQRTNEPDAKRELAAAAARIGIVGSMNSYLVSSGTDLSHVALQPYLGTVCRHLKESLCPEGISLRCDVSDCVIDSDRALYVGLIVNELVTNAIKHAFPDGRGEIRVALTCEPEQMALIVCDNGRGKETAVATTDAQRGLGTRLLHMMVGRVRGTMQELSGPGTGYRIEIPI